MIFDAFYRFLPPGFDENDNAAVAGIYNLLDQIAARLECAIVVIHHSSKGGQAEKSITDVGSGAGAMSRAADAHIVARAHEEPGAVVVDAACRSFPPIKPLCLRWDFPVWHNDDTLDPTRLKRDRGRGGRPPKSALKEEIEAAAKEADKVVWTPETFAKTFITSTPQTEDEIYCSTDLATISGRQAKQLLGAATAKGYAHRWRGGPRDPVRYGTIPPPAPPTAVDSAPEKVGKGRGQ